MVIHWTSWVRFWNIFYGTAHMAVTIFVLGYLFALKPGAYQRCRTVFIIMNVLALSGYAGYPLMPPRLVNACDDPYGGCMKGYRFVDTLHEVRVCGGRGRGQRVRGLFEGCAWRARCTR